MANIGTTTAFYKVESSLTRANNEVSKSMERLATGKQNANAGDRSSYVAMSDTFRMDFVGTKAGIKGASVAMGYLETGMRVLDAASKTRIPVSRYPMTTEPPLIPASVPTKSIRNVSDMAT